jgi:N-acetylmuramic acid 6-phosphate etherase
MDPETITPRLKGFDTWNDQDVLETLWQGQAGAIAAVRAVLPALASAARDIANRLDIGGRLIFVGAGTSGQIAALEATEIPVTYGWPEERVFHRTPGFRPPAQGVAEENADYAAGLMKELHISPLDAVIAIAASGDTPFTCAAASHAFANGALVVALFNRENCLLRQKAHHPVYLATGIEIPAGSTRMNAGTGQKAALNLISALVMTRLGRVHDGLMVDLIPDRPKFRHRARQTIAAIAECSPERADDLLLQAGGNIKQAVLMANGRSRAESGQLLAECGGNLRKALLSNAED